MLDASTHFRALQIPDATMQCFQRNANRVLSEKSSIKLHIVSMLGIAQFSLEERALDIYSIFIIFALFINVQAEHIESNQMFSQY